MKKAWWAVPAAVICGALILGGCHKKKEPQVQVNQDQKEAAQAVDKRIDQLKKNLALLQTEADKLGAQAKEKYQKVTAELEPQIQKVRERADYLRTHSDEQWEQVKNELNKTLDGVEKRYSDLKSSLVSAVSPGSVPSPKALATPAPTPKL